jgi:methionyl-tRNA formyltransferase
VQQDQLASPAPKIFKDDCRIRWAQSGQTVHNFVRGLSPAPGAWTTHEGKVLKIYRTRISDSRHVVGKEPGTVVAVDRKILCVATSNDAISVVEIQQEGKKRMGVEEFLRGYPLRVGDVFS